MIRHHFENVFEFGSGLVQSLFDVLECPIYLLALVFGPDARIVLAPASCIGKQRMSSGISVP